MEIEQEPTSSTINEVIVEETSNYAPSDEEYIDKEITTKNTRKRKNPNPKRAPPAKKQKIQPVNQEPIVICLSDSEEEVEITGQSSSKDSDSDYKGKALKPNGICSKGIVYYEENSYQTIKLLSSTLEYKIRGKTQRINYKNSKWMVR